MGSLGGRPSTPRVQCRDSPQHNTSSHADMSVETWRILSRKLPCWTAVTWSCFRHAVLSGWQCRSLLHAHFRSLSNTFELRCSGWPASLGAQLIPGELGSWSGPTVHAGDARRCAVQERIEAFTWRTTTPESNHFSMQRRTPSSPPLLSLGHHA